ncbi:MAG: DUF4239 domain-containing protein [Actinobacteria bacterium]|nr:DUF4239 domain-containing protein [Actinomycetota bacterium]MBV8562685.1 DUF4239 domain-containing protein [Actinomycetota bacterium]
MNRWLLNTFTTWQLALIVIGAFVLLALVGVALLKQRPVHLREGDGNQVAGVVLGVVSGIYGIMLALVIVSLYTSYQQAGSDIRAEASTISMVYRDSRGFAPPVATAVRDQIGAYVHDVTGPEWRALRQGGESQAAWNHLNGLYRILQAYEPRTTSQKTFYTEVVGRVNDLVAARRARLNDAEQSIPPTFEVLLVGGAVLVLAFTFLFGVRSPRLHAAMALAVAVLLGFNLLVALVLDYPFSGQVSVSNAPYTQGALAVFASERGR